MSKMNYERQKPTNRYIGNFNPTGKKITGLSNKKEEVSVRSSNNKVMPFGKYKNYQFSDIPLDYLVWLGQSADNMNHYLREEVEKTVYRKLMAADSTVNMAMVKDLLRKK